jgi:ureidoglycolate lyase
MENAGESVRQIACKPLTLQNFSSFGQVIDPAGVVPETINEGTSKRYSDLAALDLNTDAARPKMSVYVSHARHFPLQISKLERHVQSSQVFIPLGMHRFALVVALGGDTPDAASMTAFLTSPGQSICLHRGTWHHSLLALGDGDRFAVIDGGNYRADTQEFTLAQAVWLEQPQDGERGTAPI